MNDTDSPRISQPDSQHSRKTTPIDRAWVLVPLLLCVIAVFMFRRDVANNLSGQDSPAIGKPAPQVDLVRLPHEPTMAPIRSLDAGKVTLIHCWGTWCGPCKMEYPELVAMTREFESDPRFVFFSVSCEGGPGATFESLWTETHDYFQSANLVSTAYADPMGVTRRSLAERLEHNALYFPTSVLVNGDGNIAGVWEGYAENSVSQIKSVVTALIADCEK